MRGRVYPALAKLEALGGPNSPTKVPPNYWTCPKCGEVQVLCLWALGRKGKLKLLCIQKGVEKEENDTKISNFGWHNRHFCVIGTDSVGLVFFGSKSTAEMRCCVMVEVEFIYRTTFVASVSLICPTGLTTQICKRRNSPGDSSRDLFIPKRWRSRFALERVTFSPSQKGHKELPGTEY